MKHCRLPGCFNAFSIESDPFTSTTDDTINTLNRCVIFTYIVIRVETILTV